MATISKQRVSNRRSKTVIKKSTMDYGFSLGACQPIINAHVHEKCDHFANPKQKTKKKQIKQFSNLCFSIWIPVLGKKKCFNQNSIPVLRKVSMLLLNAILFPKSFCILFFKEMLSFCRYYLIKILKKNIWNTSEIVKPNI